MTCQVRVRKIAATPGPGQNRPCCVVRRYPIPVTYEPETVAYLQYADIAIPNDDTVYFPSTIYQITGLEIWTYVDALFVSVKNRLGLPLGVNNLNTIFRYWYLRVGGTATRHKVNSIDPGVFDGAFYGGWTHDGSGALPNGTNAYFDTNCPGGVGIGVDNINGNDHCLAVHLKTNTDGLMMEIFCNDGARAFTHLYARFSGNMLVADGLNGNTAKANAVADSLGHFAVNRPTVNSFKSVKAGTVLGTHADTSQADYSEVNILEACYAGSSQFSDRKRTHFHGGVSFSDAILLGIRNDIVTFETAMNR